MAERTFTNQQLVEVFAKVAREGGTRKDVVLAVLALTGASATDKEAVRKTYNNVTQRMKQLTTGEHPVNLPALKQGKKGHRRTAAEAAALNALLAVEPVSEKAADETAQAAPETATPEG